MRLKSINGSSWASIVSSKRYRYSYDSLKSVRAAIEILNQVSRARLRQSGQAVSLIQRRPTTQNTRKFPSEKVKRSMSSSVSPVKTQINVGHSPDPDDAFMFHALANDKIDTGAYTFTHTLQDIETLNKRALNAELELTAISLHAYAYLTETYALCACGASIGDGYGPMVVARQPGDIAGLRGKKIAVPGTLTTAFLTLKLLLGDEFSYEVHPFDEILNVVEAGGADAGLIIHEGQLTYADQGLNLIVDLGKWWQEDTGLPLPLGANAIRKDLGETAMDEVTVLLKQSISYGLEHRAEALEYALQFGRDLDRSMADKFVGMYVNDWTLDFGERGREAVATLLKRGHDAGVIPNPVSLEFIG